MVETTRICVDATRGCYAPDLRRIAWLSSHLGSLDVASWPFTACGRCAAAQDCTNSHSRLDRTPTPQLARSQGLSRDNERNVMRVGSGSWADLSYIALHCLPHMRFRSTCSCSDGAVAAASTGAAAGRSRPDR